MSFSRAMHSDRAAVLAAAGLLAAMLAGCSPRGGDFARPELPVPTPEGLVDASDPQPVSDIAWRYGEASWTRDGLGDPRIEAEMGGRPYAIEFYGCDEGRACAELRFVARFALADEDKPDRPASRQALVWKLDRWNAGRRFGKASLGDEPGEVTVEMNATLAGGVTRQNLDSWFDWWRVVLAEFSDFAES